MTQPTNTSEEASTVTDRMLDRVDAALMPDKADQVHPDRYKNPFVQRVLMALLFGFFLVIVIYFTAMVFQIPLPESKILEAIIMAIISMIKFFATT